MVTNALAETAMQSFLVYSDTMSLILRMLFYSISFIAGIYIIYKNYNMIKAEKWTGLALLLVMSLIALGVVRNAIFAMQQEPELTITQQGIWFHTLGFLPWSAVENARIMPYKPFFIPIGRRAGSLLRITLKQDSGWKSETYSLFSISYPYKNKAIIVKDVLAIDRAELKDILIQMNPGLRLN